MAADILEQLDVQAELIKEGGGIFDVAVDGEVIFSRHAEGRFPEHDEVIQAIQSRNVDSA